MDPRGPLEELRVVDLQEESVRLLSPERLPVESSLLEGRP
jgi:hypothetical protein